MRACRAPSARARRPARAARRRAPRPAAPRPAAPDRRIAHGRPGRPAPTRCGARARRGARPRPAGGASGTASAKAGPAKAAPAKRTKAARKGAAPARRRRFTPPEPARVTALLGLLERIYPDARSALDFRSPLQLLIATILSAQCTDERVNQTTPALFERFPDAVALAGADLAELEGLIRSTGFFRMKAKAIQSCCADIVAKHGGEVPRTMEALTALRGVGRKTANVVLGNAYGIPGLVVDTHVTRLSHRLGLTRETDAVKIEYALQPLVPQASWTLFSHWLILHGRRVCVARKPRCSVCPLAPHCPRLGVTASQ